MAIECLLGCLGSSSPSHSFSVTPIKGQLPLPWFGVACDGPISHISVLQSLLPPLCSPWGG